MQNILIDEVTLRIYLCDFGFATYFNDGTRFEKWCGSPHTVAPEIIKRIPYVGTKVDVWSLGSVLYTMICAFFPFQATVPKDVLKRTVSGKFHSFPSGCGSRAARDLISRCLTADPGKPLRCSSLLVTMPPSDELIHHRSTIVTRPCAAASFLLDVRDAGGGNGRSCGRVSQYSLKRRYSAQFCNFGWNHAQAEVGVAENSSSSVESVSGDALQLGR